MAFYTEEQYQEAVQLMFEASRCALWHVTQHEQWQPCKNMNDTCECERHEDALGVLMKTHQELKNIKPAHDPKDDKQEDV